MYQFSETLQAALSAGNRQRVLIEFTEYEGDDGSPVQYDEPVVFSNEDIMINRGLQWRTSFNTETDLTIGQCTSAEIRFTLRNDLDQLNDFEFGTFRAWLGAMITSGTPASGAKTMTFPEGLYEFAPLGVFIATRPNVVRSGTIDVTAHDMMTLFDKDMPPAEEIHLTFPTTLGYMLGRMCAHLDITLGTPQFLNYDLAVAKKPKNWDTYTMREMLRLIAEAACSMARFGRDGSLELVWFNPVNKTFDETNYSTFNEYWYETKAIDKLHIRNADSTTEYKVGNGANAYMIQDNPFLRQKEA